MEILNKSSRQTELHEKRLKKGHALATVQLVGLIALVTEKGGSSKKKGLTGTSSCKNNK